MEITLIHYTPLKICSHAIRTCWQSFDKGDSGGELDRALIDKVGNRYKHSSTLEHLVYTFYIKGISRALLQELSRHRVASLSVKSTRYTLKELKNQKSFDENDFERNFIRNKIIPLIKERLNKIQALNSVQNILKQGVSNDIAKFCLPESYKTELTWTINARSLQNFLKLRSSKSALWEIREMAINLYKNLPQAHQYLFQEYLINNK